MSEQGDPKAFVLLRYPGAERVGGSHCGFRIVSCPGTEYVKSLSRIYQSEASAWKSAARRLGWRGK